MRIRLKVSPKRMPSGGEFQDELIHHEARREGPSNRVAVQGACGLSFALTPPHSRKERESDGSD